MEKSTQSGWTEQIKSNAAVDTAQSQNQKRGMFMSVKVSGGSTGDASMSFSTPKSGKLFYPNDTPLPSQEKKPHGKTKTVRKTKVGSKRATSRVEPKNNRGKTPRLRKDAVDTQVHVGGRVYKRDRKNRVVARDRKVSRGGPKLCFIPTWHPAYLFKDMARGGRSFLLHVQKAVEIALGKREDPLPEILKDPTEKKAKEVFKSWEKEGWAVDVETPDLKEYRLLSVAVCGSKDLAMVWNTTKPRKLTALRAALAGPTRKIVQNGDFDINVFLACGFKTDPETYWDTMIEGAIMHPDEPVNLSFLASMATDIESWKFRREGDLFTYNVIDAWATWMIYLQNQKNYEEESWG